MSLYTRDLADLAKREREALQALEHARYLGDRAAEREALEQLQALSKDALAHPA